MIERDAYRLGYQFPIWKSQTDGTAVAAPGSHHPAGSTAAGPKESSEALCSRGIPVSCEFPFCAQPRMVVRRW